jgi:hypothetical protein
MSKRRTPTAVPLDSTIGIILRSSEYRDSLKARLLAGRATSAELQLALQIGLEIGPTQAPDPALALMGSEFREVFLAILKMADDPYRRSRLRVIKAGSIRGIGYDETNAIPVDQTTQLPSAEPQTTDEDTLLPPKVPAG